MKALVTTIAVTLLTLSGAVSAFGGSSANVTAGQQQQQLSKSQATNAGNAQDVTVNIDQSEPETRGLEQSQITQDVRYSGEYSVKNVPAVSAPALTTTLTETCMGSTSVGAGWVGFGFSFGSTWRDSACVRRLDARQLSSLGYNLGAKELMCDSDAVRAALKRAGKPCYVDLPTELKRPEDQEPVVVAPAAGSASW